MAPPNPPHLLLTLLALPLLVCAAGCSITSNTFFETSHPPTRLDHTTVALDLGPARLERTRTGDAALVFPDAAAVPVRTVRSEADAAATRHLLGPRPEDDFVGLMIT